MSQQNPAPRDENGEIIIDEAARSASQKKLLLIFALFFVPLLLATIWLQMVKASGGAWGNTSRGELIAPAVPFSEFSLRTLGDDAPFGLDDVRGKWTVLYVPGEECAADCEKTLLDIRQARLALNHRMDRVNRVLLVDNDPQFSNEFLQELSGVQIVSGEDDALAVFVNQINAAQSSMEAKENIVYLIDPNGNLMMRYTPDQLPRPMFKDLKHLLKVSRIG